MDSETHGYSLCPGSVSLEGEWTWAMQKKSENVENEPSGTQESGRGRRLWERGTGPLSGARRERAESQGGISGFVLGGQELREERG